jgi:hypothetical protein
MRDRNGRGSELHWIAANLGSGHGNGHWRHGLHLPRDVGGQRDRTLPLTIEGARQAPTTVEPYYSSSFGYDNSTNLFNLTVFLVQGATLRSRI